MSAALQNFNANEMRFCAKASRYALQASFPCAASVTEPRQKDQSQPIYRVEAEASEEDKDDGWTVLGSGSYGKVFLAATPQGRPCAVKVFSGRHATEGAENEAGLVPGQPMVPCPSCSQPFCRTMAMDVIVLWGLQLG